MLEKDITKKLWYEAISELPVAVRSNSINIKTEKVTFCAEIKTEQIFDIRKKTISIYTHNNCSYDEIKNVMIKLIRFEELFDGIFFHPVKLIIDDKDVLNYEKSNWLHFYNGKSKELSTTFSFDFSCTDDRYLEYYNNFNNLTYDGGKIMLIHQVYLYSEHSQEMTKDLRCALLLQVFEHYSQFLECYEVIPKIVTHKKVQHKCNKCGNITEEERKLTFADRLNATVAGYKDIFFIDEDTYKIIKLATGLRNRIFHVDIKKKKTQFFNGAQCAFYRLKFSLLYRLYMLKLIGLDEKSHLNSINSYIKKINNQYIGEENMVILTNGQSSCKKLDE